MPQDQRRPVSSLDARLAEIDRRLSAIQNDLLSARAQPPADPPPPTPPEELGRLATAHDHALRELLAAYEHALTAGPPRPFEVDAGPFSSTGALHEFEAALARLPHVRQVTLRSFQGSDRVVFEVRLAEPSP